MGDGKMADDIALKKAKSGEKDLSGLDLSRADLRWLGVSCAGMAPGNAEMGEI